MTQYERTLKEHLRMSRSERLTSPPRFTKNLYFTQYKKARPLLQPVRREARRELLAESHKHSGVKLLRQIPSIGPIRSALLVALLQTPHRFRTKRQLWAYSGFAVQTHDSGEYRSVPRQTATQPRTHHGARTE